MNKSGIFQEQLKTFETEDIKQFTVLCLEELPEYFFSVPASSTGRHHNAVDCLECGLVFHTKAAFTILNYILEIEKLNPVYKFSSRERDLMRCAILLHDGFKQGTQEEYNSTEEHSTQFLHPLFAAKFVLGHKDCGVINRKEISKISSLIASHMGTWNEREDTPDVRLPIPVLPEEKVVHLADYLASRENIILTELGDYTVTIN